MLKERDSLSAFFFPAFSKLSSTIAVSEIIGAT